jgi:quinol monooxygenase YgiN
MIHVIATVSLAPGTRGRFLEVFNANVPSVLAEDGCLEYGAAIDTPADHPAQGPLRPDVVVVVEKWRDLPALKAHSAAPHMTAYRARARDYILSVSLQVLEPATPSA